MGNGPPWGGRCHAEGAKGAWVRYVQGSRAYYRHCSSMQLSLRAPPAGSGIVVASQRKDGGSVAAAAEKDVEDFEAEWQRAARFDAGELNAASSW
eukprot:SAG25_NODE_5158_length_695_cov_0.864094_2_plen_94_part_01